MSSLYELQGEWLEVMSMMEDDDIDPQVIEDTLESITGAIEEKAVAYAKIMKNIEGEAEAIKKEEERLAKRRRAMENHVSTMKTRLESAMKMVDKKEIKTSLFSFKIQKNPASVVMDTEDISAIPEEFLVPQDPKINKALIKEMLTAGAKYDFAHLEQKESLRIR